jgi:UDP-N-acetyl-D-mannosaminuronic acid dehydrogenase
MSKVIVNKIEYEIVVIGMGYVGLTYSLHLNTFGYSVKGIDNNEKTKNLINNRVLPFYEEGIEGRLNNFVKQGLLAVDSPEDFSKKQTVFPKIYVVTVGTPVNSNKINKSSLNKVFEFLNKNINDGDAIVLRSTVPIGFTRSYCESLKKKIKYCFAPERTIEGKATFELATLPQIYGSNDEESKVFFKEFFGLVSAEVFEVSKSESAELVKLTSNVYRDVTFSFSNEISLISHKNNINSKEVIEACNYKYPRCNIYSSGPVAGPCLSKDAYILSESIDEKFTNSMILSSRKLNENYIIDILGKLINGVKSVSILGLSFKGTPPTNDIRDSYALTLIDFLKSKSIEVSSYDPLVFDEDFKSIKLKRDNTLEDAFLNKDLIIIQNNNEIFKRMNINKLSNLLNKDAIILDLWSLHTNIEINNSKYIGI